MMYIYKIRTSVMSDTSRAGRVSICRRVVPPWATHWFHRISTPFSDYDIGSRSEIRSPPFGRKSRPTTTSQAMFYCPSSAAVCAAWMSQ